MKQTYKIDGMHCGSCVAKVSEALREVAGVTDAEVTLDPPRAEVEMQRHVETDTLNQAVAAAGDYSLEEAADKSGDEDTSTATIQQEKESLESLYPLILIVGYLLGAVLLIHFTVEGVTWMDSMRHFMAGFFLTFSFFKLLDPPGFVSAYRGYDLLARRSKAWAWTYPYVELALGVAYLINFYPIPTNIITLVLMLVGAVGVLKAVLDKRAIRCACLGTALNLPMTKVTLIEDLTMAVMAAIMLAWHALA